MVASGAQARAVDMANSSSYTQSGMPLMIWFFLPSVVTVVMLPSCTWCM